MHWHKRVSQSRRLPSWPPLARCTVVCEMNRCDMSAAFDRTDGKCYYCGKKADGLFGPRRNGLRTNGKYHWADFFDGAPHEVVPPHAENFRRAAYAAAIRQGLTITVRVVGDTVHLQSQRNEPRAA